MDLKTAKILFVLNTVHRDTYVLGQGFWLFPRYQAHLEKDFFSMKCSLITKLQYLKRIFDICVKLLPIHLLLNVKKYHCAVALKWNK